MTRGGGELGWGGAVLWTFSLHCTPAAPTPHHDAPRCRTERVVTAATAAPFLRQVVRKALYPREARGADFALSLLASVTDLQVRDQREHAHTPQCLSVLPGSRRVRGGRNEWWLRRQLSNDLQVAKVYVSVLADQERKEATVEALCKLSGYVPLAASSHSHPQLGVTTRAACVGCRVRFCRERD